MSIVLRPHHLLCTQGYSGHGYSEAFVEHMNDVVHQLRDGARDEDPAHLLHRHPLFLLPQQAGHRPVRHTGKGQAVRPQDRGDFGLEEKEYDYQALIREIDAKATPEMLADICRDCCWFPISACCKNICEGKYVK